MKVSRLVLAGLITLGSLASAPAKAIAAESPYLVLEIRESGGFIPREFLFDRIPLVAVYSDGTVLASRPVRIQVYPGPAAPTVLRKSAAADLTRILQAASAARLTDAKFDFGRPPIADAPSTEITWRLSPRGATFTRSIDALSISSDYGLTKDQVAARESARSFVDQLAGFSGTLIRTKSMPTSWLSPRWIYSATPAAADSSSIVRTWVGSALSAPVWCGEFTSSQNSRIRTLAPKLNQASRWLSNRKLWQVRLRPLWPHETGCDTALR